jgi:hypothetical protein
MSLVINRDHLWQEAIALAPSRWSVFHSRQSQMIASSLSPCGHLGHIFCDYATIPSSKASALIDNQTLQYFNEMITLAPHGADIYSISTYDMILTHHLNEMAMPCKWKFHFLLPNRPHIPKLDTTQHMYKLPLNPMPMFLQLDSNECMGYVKFTPRALMSC